MTDNCSELREALSKRWPASILLLCVFHLMQQVWRWIFEKKHSVHRSDRTVILLLFKRVVYAKEEEEMENAYEEMISTDVVSKYSIL